MNEQMDEIQIYQTRNDRIEVNVQFEKETVWLNLSQLARLFERDRTVIGRHIRNIFNEAELDEKLVCANFAHTTQHGAIKGKSQTKKLKYYNLDVIISVGYRVKSKQATKFRIWANEILKEYLLQGYAINKKRLKQKEQEVQILKGGIQILNRAIGQSADKANREMLKLFAQGLALLDDYDHETLDIKGNSSQELVYPSEDEYLAMIKEMYSDFESEVFAQPKDESFSSSIAQIGQTFDGIELYPSLEVKAANLLYLIVKNHSFIDGNKRIAAACFLYFLDKNKQLVFDGKTIISNEALATLTLFIATSKPAEHEIVKRLIVSILNRSLIK